MLLREILPAISENHMRPIMHENEVLRISGTKRQSDSKWKERRISYFVFSQYKIVL